MFEDLLLARGTAQYYALEQLFRYAPAHQSYWRQRPYREPKHRVRKALARLSASFTGLFGQHRKPEVQGCG
ncbi:MAG TPA: hypothetical protein VJL84_09785 [Kiloniellales bacterium]|nr:hypothetical protein [Kiloniellales bacterium]